MGAMMLPQRLRQQPQQAAVLDQSNPLVRGLVFASVAGGPDLISGVFPVKFGSGARSVFDQGRTLYTPGVTSDGWYWPLPANHPLYGITSQDTLFVLAKRIAGSSFNNLLGVPYKSGAWANPYYAWGLSGQSDNTMGAYTFAVNSSTRNSTTSASGLFANNITQAVGATRSGTRIRFYNGSLQFGGDQAITAGSPDWTNKQPLCLFNRSNTSPGEGMQAHAGLVLVWNRELSPAEWASLAANPWQLFRAPARRLWAKAAASSGTSTTLTPGGASLALAGYAPAIVQAVKLSPAGASLSLTGYAPALSQAAGLSPSGAALSLSTYAPAIVQPRSLSPGGLSLTMAGAAPQVTQAAPLILSPSGASLALTGYAPGVVQVKPVNLSPAGALLALAGRTPMVMQGTIPEEQATGGAYGVGSVRMVWLPSNKLPAIHLNAPGV